jgi:hypothetical protein
MCRIGTAVETRELIGKAVSTSFGSLDAFAGKVQIRGTG